MDLWHTIHSARNERGQWFGTPSVPELARRHAEAHRWYESERLGCDVGPSAYRQWRQLYWRTFCRWRYLEHLLGICCYREFSAEQFGSLRDCLEWSRDTVVEFALHRVLHEDCEQLEVLFEAPEDVPRHRLVEVLAILDFNAARLSPPEWTES
ncbi:MAG: hypothetical protein KDA75_21910 [Planctomycetaceae bacterium]|nr:hypothetical protein [Planctomycetaceae bacterium]